MGALLDEVKRGGYFIALSRRGEDENCANFRIYRICV